MDVKEDIVLVAEDWNRLTQMIEGALLWTRPFDVSYHHLNQIKDWLHEIESFQMSYRS